MPDNDSQREYGELVATVTQLSKLITKLESRLDSLITRSEYDYRVGKVEQDVEGLSKRLFYKTEQNTRKIEGIQDVISTIKAATTKGAEKLANAERLLWAALAAAGWLVGAIVNSGFQL